MAKRTGAPKLQEDIQTDEDLKIVLDRPGLWVLDIYSDWCGPCLGMVNSLRKIKLEIGGDLLSFAICKADTMSVFSRFRRKSEPTWLFVTNKKAVNIMFGTNVPNLMALIAQELRFLTLKTRNYYELDEYQPIEQARRKIKEDAINEIITQEREEKERIRIGYLNFVTDTIMENLPDMGVTIFGPQVTRDMLKKSIQIAEQMKMQCKDRTPVIISIKDFETIHYACPNPIPDELLEQFDGKELFVCFWKVLGTGHEVPKQLHELANELQSERKQMIMEDDMPKEVTVPPILTPLDLNIEIELGDDESSESDRSEDDLSRASSSTQLSQEEQDRDEQLKEESLEGDEEEVAEEPVPLNLDFDIDLTEGAEETIEVDETPKRRIRIKKIRIPPIWVADNHRTHAALIYKYFRNQTNAFLPPDPEPEPPYIIMAFDSYKKRDLVLHCERHKDQVPMYGFFTSDEPEEAKFIANSLEKYKPETTNDKIILKVKKVTSHHMLELVSYGPSYVSPNITVGKEEVLKFFPPTYKTADQEAEEEAELHKTDKKDKKTKKTAHTNAAAATPAPPPAPTPAPAPVPEVTGVPANIQQTEDPNTAVNTEAPAVAA